MFPGFSARNIRAAICSLVSPSPTHPSNVRSSSDSPESESLPPPRSFAVKVALTRQCPTYSPSRRLACVAGQRRISRPLAAIPSVSALNVHPEVVLRPRSDTQVGRVHGIGARSSSSSVSARMIPPTVNPSLHERADSSTNSSTSVTRCACPTTVTLHPWRRARSTHQPRMPRRDCRWRRPAWPRRRPGHHVVSPQPEVHRLHRRQRVLCGHEATHPHRLQ